MLFPTVTIYRWIRTSILPVEFGKDITAVQKRRTSETGYLKTSFSNHKRFEEYPQHDEDEGSRFAPELGKSKYLS